MEFKLQPESTVKERMNSISLNVHELFSDFWRFSFFTK